MGFLSFVPLTGVFSGPSQRLLPGNLWSSAPVRSLLDRDKNSCEATCNEEQSVFNVEMRCV